MRTTLATWCWGDGVVAGGWRVVYATVDAVGVVHPQHSPAQPPP